MRPEGFEAVSRWVDLLNLVAAVASILGTLIGIPSLLIALVQLRQTRRAAEAASSAARDTLSRISEVAAVASLEQICGRSRELLRLARERHLGSTATAAFELLEAVSKFSMSSVAAEINTSEEWSRLQKKASEIHGAYINAAAINKIDTQAKQELLLEISELHSSFNMMASRAGERARGIHGDS